MRPGPPCTVCRLCPHSMVCRDRKRGLGRWGDDLALSPPPSLCPVHPAQGERPLLRPVAGVLCNTHSVPRGNEGTSWLLAEVFGPAGGAECSQWAWWQLPLPVSQMTALPSQGCFTEPPRDIRGTEATSRPRQLPTCLAELRDRRGLLCHLLECREITSCRQLLAVLASLGMGVMTEERHGRPLPFSL